MRNHQDANEVNARLVRALRDCLALLESDTVILVAEGWEEVGEIVLAIKAARNALTEVEGRNR